MNCFELKNLMLRESENQNDQEKKVNLRKQFWYGVSGLKRSKRKFHPAFLVS